MRTKESAPGLMARGIGTTHFWRGQSAGEPSSACYISNYLAVSTTGKAWVERESLLKVQSNPSGNRAGV